ncbi:MAG: manganese efflux pump [Defluviitaleaceae bacterium]|nr:manganese efflux pump [Defluviitaleaceae bacterium]MCL2835577.1 manganese efflux pump [Defluviitaleaceae bacterium]
MPAVFPEYPVLSTVYFMEALLLTATLSVDALAAGFAYGGNGIKIGFWKAMIINIICGAVLGLSLLAGASVRGFMPAWLTAVICFTILFILGLIKLINKSEAARTVKSLSAGEAAVLALALSLDGLAAGFGAALGNINIPTLLAASLVMNLLAVLLGCHFGGKIARKRLNMNWLAGMVLIGLAVTKLVW